MLIATLVLLGGSLVALALIDRAVQRLPMTPALVYLVLGAAAGWMLEGPDTALLAQHAGALAAGVEFALLASLFAIGLRLPLQAPLRSWRVALMLAGPAMLVTIGLAALAATWLLGLPWPAALLVAAILAPTDPVLASEIRIRSDNDRDAVRWSLTAEGGLNDGTALPVVALALGLAGLGGIGNATGAGQPYWWWWSMVVWPLIGGAALGLGLGWLLGHFLRVRAAHGDPMARDELIYVGAVALAFGLAHAFALSSFIVAFVVGATLLLPLHQAELDSTVRQLADRLHAFGGRLERLVEAATVLAVGALLSALPLRGPDWLYALALVLIARPLAVLAVVRRADLPASQRRLVAWFGIRGIGSLYYLLFAMQHGASGTLAEDLTRITLACIALSIVLHGVSATPLMLRRKAAPQAAQR